MNRVTVCYRAYGAGLCGAARGCMPGVAPTAHVLKKRRDAKTVVHIEPPYGNKYGLELALSPAVAMLRPCSAWRVPAAVWSCLDLQC